jgi:hypothetical protein
MMGLILSGMACADMMPITPAYKASPQEGRNSDETPADRAGLLTPLSNASAVEARDLGIDVSLKGIFSETEAGVDVPVMPCVVIRETSSFRLCLYGLFGLGLCQCAPWIRKGYLGITPAWYHDGGPHQIGHSYAVLPGSELCVQACCFVQPMLAFEQLSLNVNQGTIEFLLRKSHANLLVFTSRGPPSA